MAPDVYGYRCVWLIPLPHGLHVAAVSAIVGPSCPSQERLAAALQRLPPGEEHGDWVASQLRTLDGLLQSGLYMWQLGQSRRQEYEADQLALRLGAGAGMSRREARWAVRHVAETVGGDRCLLRDYHL